MSWIIYASISALLIAMYNLFLEGTKNMQKHLKDKDNIYQTHIFLSFVLVFSGIISSFVLVYYKINEPRQINIFMKNGPSPLKIITPSILIVLYMLSNIMALTKGGGIAGTTFMNGAAILTLIGSVLLFNEKINKEIIFTVLVSAISIYYMNKESIAINNK